MVAVLYRPSSYKIQSFRNNLVKLVEELDSFPGGKVLMGDFNEDIFKSSTIADLMEQYKYRQCVKTATTESGTLIDHVYVKDIKNESVQVIPAYYSVHEAIRFSITP